MVSAGFWGCEFQHTELEHTPKATFFQQAVKGILS